MSSRTSRPPTLSAKEHLVLDLLVANGPSYGLQLVGASHGRLKRGTVYVTLGRMEEKGYVESQPDPEAADHLVLPRRIYQPSAYGLKVLEAWEAMRRVLELGPAHRFERWEGAR
jgi:PadR family transcriptional regulator, regulatory protein PadR